MDGGKSRKRAKQPQTEEPTQNDAFLKAPLFQSPSNRKLEPKHVKQMVNEQLSPSPNSNSFSQIYDQFYPRTPIKTVRESASKNKSNKDQLDQLLEKGILEIALVYQVSFNSTKSFSQLKNTLDCGLASDCFGFLQNAQKFKKSLEMCQFYERRGRTDTADMSLFAQRHNNEIQQSRQQHVTTMINLYSCYRQEAKQDTFFIYSTPMFITLFGYQMVTRPSNPDMDEENHQPAIVPFALYITRSAATSNSFTLRNAPQVPLFLSSNQIKSTVVSIDPLLNNLIPSVISLQFPGKYSVNLVQGKYIHHLFNILLNLSSDKDAADIVASYSFHGSRHYVSQIYNGSDLLVTETENQKPKSIFEQQVKHPEFKITYDGILTIKQILQMKQQLKEMGYSDIVVSETKLNPITTLLTQNTIDKINPLLQAQL